MDTYVWMDFKLWKVYFATKTTSIISVTSKSLLVITSRVPENLSNFSRRKMMAAPGFSLVETCKNRPLTGGTDKGLFNAQVSERSKINYNSQSLEWRKKKDRAYRSGRTIVPGQDHLLPIYRVTKDN